MIVIVRTDRVANTVLPSRCRYLTITNSLVDKIQLIWYEVTVDKFYFLIDHAVTR